MRLLAFATVLSLSLTALAQDPPRPPEPPKPTEAEPKKDQEKDKAGEELFKKIEEKAVGAKTLRYKGKMAMEAGGQTIDFEAEGRVKGDKAKLEMSGEMMGQAMEVTVRCDGSKVLVEASGPMGKGNEEESEFDMPKKFGEGLRTALVRGGLFITMFFGDKKSRDPDLDLKTLLTASDFKIGKEEKVGEKACKVVHYTLTLDGKNDTGDVTLWVDAETLLPVKHEVTIRTQTFTETYSEWKLDEEIKDEVFALKAGEKKEEKKEDKKEEKK